jgi:hypothetical protein
LRAAQWEKGVAVSEHLKIETGYSKIGLEMWIKKHSSQKWFQEGVLKPLRKTTPSESLVG